MKKTLQLPIILLTFIILLSSCVNKKINNSIDLEAQKDAAKTYSLEPGLYEVDSDKTIIEWLGKKPTGSHNGDIKLKKGSIKIDEKGNISAGNFIFDMTTINCTDLEGKPKTNIEGHLKSEDFFNVEKFPEASFEIKESDDKKMSGILTMKNNSNPITFNYTRTGPLEFKAEFIVDRTLYDIKYGSKSFFSDLGDKFINDDIEIKLNPITFK
ncbi:MAG: lipid-binding protein [Flavobacteriales bacterium]|nr:lipid-binding protein [Flavobacteriales bacterium]